MLSELWINNIAIIKTENIAFSAPFTVLTGETGAGKSIIIDAIELALGARADKELVRHGEEKASAAAVFTDGNIAYTCAFNRVPRYIKNTVIKTDSAFPFTVDAHDKVVFTVVILFFIKLWQKR